MLFLQAAHLCQRLLAAQQLCHGSSSSINKRQVVAFEC
jgi:hypothetical protein